jgi:dienelactone hydrolase
MKSLLGILVLLFSINSYAQNLLPADYGYRHLQTVYKGDTVDILIKSKKGEEQVKKPIFLFCQGSLPIPLIVKYDDNGKKGTYPVFVFNPDSLSTEYHLAIIGKPYVPLIADQRNLNPDLSYTDSSTGLFPAAYLDRNLLDYYTKRNIHALKFLRKQSWVETNQLVVAGHSEGSTIAAKIANDYSGVTQLIYSGGNPLGRIMTLLSRSRANEDGSSAATADIFEYWKNVITGKDSMTNGGDTFKGMYQFSCLPAIDYLKKTRIPVLVTFGVKDSGVVASVDYLRAEIIRLKRSNFTFKEYQGEHNFFPLKENGEVNFDIFNWDKVADDWRAWLLHK